ncbi:M16 family metallopeptidase [Inhella gelatinilytica]|uniref:Insulinase family protein n=1 Tax=Inhella gelatinilytica TaxID=2795030 RepID=A0A931IXE0_9BURK|nr:pitrilysin family protein [Inhella gelatinilytica]MBH9552824.1 insulinase family protein [Inhella gelatinilytica]
MHALIPSTLVVTLALACASWAHATSKPVKPAVKAALAAPAVAVPQLVRELEGIREFRLANGLQVLLFADAASTTTLVNLVYRVGSRHEGSGEAGMAHLLEHLLFKGTPSVADIPKAMSERGVRWNATTSVDRTNYFSSFNANPATLDFMLALEAERMQRSRVEAEDLAKEMPVVLNEMERGENNPGQLLRERLQAAAFRFHPYGRLTIGSRSDVENVPIESLRRFYRNHYRPDNATLMVSGQLNEAAVLAQIQQHFGPLSNPAGQAPQTYTVEPPQDGERSVVLRRVGGQAMSFIGYHAPNFAHPDCANLNLISQMLMQPPTGPLFKRFVEGKQAATVGGGGCGGFDPGLFTVVAVPTADAPLAQLEKDLLNALETQSAELLQADQFQRMQQQFATAYAQLLKNPQQLTMLLTEMVAAGDWRLVFKLLQLVKTVKLEDLHQTAARTFQANNRTVARYEPVKTSGQVAIALLANRQEGLDTLSDSAKLNAGEQLNPAPEHLQARTRWTRLTHSGLPLAWVEKKTRGDQVFGRIQLRWGDGAQAHQFHEASHVAIQLMEGNAQMSKQQLIDEAFRLKGQFNITSGPQGLTLTLEGEKASFGELLQLAFKVMRTPTFPEEAWQRRQRATVQGLQASRQEPETLRQAEVRAHYNQVRQAEPGSPDYLASLDDRIGYVQSITTDQLKAFHARYWSANEGELAFVGPLPDGLEALLDHELAAWKKPEAPVYRRHTRPFKDVPPASFHAQASDKAAALLQVRQELQFPADHPDEVALLVANHLLGGGSLESRLNTRLRQQGGLTYGIESSLTLPEWGDAGAWTLRTQFAPQNRLKVEAQIRTVLEEVLNQGFSTAEVERARKDLLEGRLQGRAKESSLAFSLTKLQEHGKTWAYTAEWDARYRTVTAEQVNAALRRYLKPEKMVWSSAGDYKAKPPVQP